MRSASADQARSAFSLWAWTKVLLSPLPACDRVRGSGLTGLAGGLTLSTGAAHEAFTGGKINAFLTHDVAKWKSYDAPFQS